MIETKFVMVWKASSKILPIDQNTKITQVYTWILTKEKKLILVSKDDINWQFPGGKPQSGETAIETALREVVEETGIDITPHKENLKFFGYYLVYELEIETNKIVNQFLQLRYKIDLPVRYDELNLTQNEKIGDGPEVDQVKHARFFDWPEVFGKIRWLKKSDEYASFLGSS